VKNVLLLGSKYGWDPNPPTKLKNIKMGSKEKFSPPLKSSPALHFPPRNVITQITTSINDM
jgi:hypothetical protein